MEVEILNKIETLPVMESFYTIQGEGYHQGKAAYFIRLGGCDVGCVWCDVKDSWDINKYPHKSVLDIVNEAKLEIENWQSKTNSQQLAACNRHSSTIAVITGGEPLMHDCTSLTNELFKAGFNTHIETSGSHPISGEWDWICLSPKKFKAPLPEILPLANELKVVIFNKSDFEWAEKYAAQVSSNCKLFLQPEWEKATTITPLIIDYIKQNPKWEFSLQLHKYISVP